MLTRRRSTEGHCPVVETRQPVGCYARSGQRAVCNNSYEYTESQRRHPMGRWLVGIAGTVIGGVLVWWLTEGVARYGNTVLRAPLSPYSSSTDDTRRPTIETTHSRSRITDRDYSDYERPVNRNPWRDEDTRDSEYRSEYRNEERERDLRERRRRRERNLETMIERFR